MQIFTTLGQPALGKSKQIRKKERKKERKWERERQKKKKKTVQPATPEGNAHASLGPELKDFYDKAFLIKNLLQYMIEEKVACVCLLILIPIMILYFQEDFQ